MKEAGRRLIAGLVMVAASIVLLGGTAASTDTSHGPTPCGKGFSATEGADEPRARSWHGLALASMLDVILPPLTEQVASAGEPKDRAPLRGSGLAKAERGLLAGVLSAAVSAGLAAIGSSLDASSEEPSEAVPTDPAPSVETGGASSNSCPEGVGSI